MVKAARTGVVILISGLLTIGALELVSWLLLDLVVPKRGQMAVAFILGQAAPYEDSPVQRRPYYYYINRPSWTKNNVVQHNAHGHRGPDTPVQREENTLRILTIGGSTTYGWLLDSWEESWPAQLAQRLTDKLQCPVQVLNAGQPGAMSSEALVAYLFRDRYFDPQIVIIHNGGNDGGPLWFADYRPDYSTYRTWQSVEITLRRGERALLAKSYFARLFYGLWLSDWRTGNMVPMPLEWPSPDDALASVQANAPTGYRRYLDLLVSNVLRDGAVPILFPFYLASEEVFDLVEPEFRYIEHIWEANKLSIQKNLPVMVEVARQHGIPLAMIPEGSIPLEHFFDHAHLKAEGELFKAEHMAGIIYNLLAEDSVHGDTHDNVRFIAKRFSHCVR